MSAQSLLICEHCDTVHRLVPVPSGTTARCAHCGVRLSGGSPASPSAMLALALAALMVFVIANLFPIIEIQLGGKSSAATLWQAILSSYDAGVSPIAALAAVTVFFFPLLQILLFLYVLLPLTRGYVPWHFASAMHALRLFQPWGMVEVFLLGVLVAMVKLVGVSEVSLGVGLWGFAALTVLLTALNSINLHVLWERVGEPA